MVARRYKDQERPDFVEQESIRKMMRTTKDLRREWILTDSTPAQNLSVNAF